MKPVVAITMGDPAGIGPEICLKAAASGKLSFCNLVIVGSGEVLENSMGLSGNKMIVNAINCVEEAKFKRGIVNVLEAGDISLDKFVPGRPSSMCGLASIDYVREAVRLAVDGEVSAIVTAPINKQALHMAKLCWTGHTELLADIFRAEVVMIFIGGNLRIAVVTRHIPISQVAEKVTKKRILKTIEIIHANRRFLGITDPSFAVLSLNPHAGEGGSIGRDEGMKVGLIKLRLL